MKIRKDGRTIVWQVEPDKIKRKRRKSGMEAALEAAPEVVFEGFEEEEEEINGNGSN